jgi:hypothetical protein
MLSPFGSPSLPCSVRQCSACALHVTKVQLSNVRLPLADWALGTITSVCFFYCHLNFITLTCRHHKCQESQARTIAHIDDEAIESYFCRNGASMNMPNLLLWQAAACIVPHSRGILVVSFPVNRSHGC